MKPSNVSWERAVEWLVSNPEYRELVHAAYFDAPLEAAAMRYWRSDEWRLVRSWGPRPPGSALDVGAGNGIATFALAKDGWNVTALEPDLSQSVGAGAIASLMASNNLPVRLITEFAEDIPVLSESIDFIVARQVLHHARDLREFCSELSRVLKPGGTLIALRDHVIRNARDLPHFLSSHPLHALYGGEHAYRLEDYLNALTSSGLGIVRVLRPFESAVNYSPNTRDSLRRQVWCRVPTTFGKSLARGLLKSERVLDAVLWAVSRFDRTPGRLYSFVCQKPLSQRG
jgi:SAM-dependent methyltransferase